MIAVVGVFAVMTAPLAVALPTTMVLRRYRYTLVFVSRFLVFFNVLCRPAYCAVVFYE